MRGMHLKNITKKVVIFSMAAVLGVAGVSGAVAFSATNTAQVAQAAVRDYQVTVKKGKSIKLSDIVSASVLKKTKLTMVSISNGRVASYSPIGDGIKDTDGEITGLRTGTATLTFYKNEGSGRMQLVYYTVTVKVIG